MIIGISAKKQHGKDSVANIIQELTSNKFKIVKFADKLKDFVCELINCSRIDLEDENFKNKPLGNEWDFIDIDGNIQKMTSRLLMQKIGTDAMRNYVHNNVWINATFSEYCERCNWIITDLRFKNEFEYIKKYEGITIRINRPSILINDDHPSETNLDNIKDFNYYIENNGSYEDLVNKVKLILIDLKLI